ncbi:response regulator [candidate division KSB1 bacterium]|nr:response regulator [candidate division KSB1 bacterium]
MKSEYEIIIVEDNPEDSELMIRSLKKNNLSNNLILLEDGELALDFFFRRGKYKEREATKSNLMIFLDLKLPKVDGLEILRQLKSNKNTKKIPVVIVTSSKQDPDINTAYELGANSYVVKPVDYEKFTETIKQLGLYWLVVNEIPENGI